ncbi:hypothetical protein Tco_0212707 [Tanacetum coccineum]
MSLFYKLWLIRNKPADEEGSGSSLCVSFVRGVENDSESFYTSWACDHSCSTTSLNLCLWIECGVLLGLHAGTDDVETGVGVIVLVYGSRCRDGEVGDE